MQGWFKFYPKTLENPIIMKDGEHLAVWTYLLMKASHKEFDIVFGNERITINPGQVVTGRRQIASDLKFDENKVYRILVSFKNAQQIEQRTDRQKSVITILNWELYQESEQRNEQRVNNDRTTSEQRVNTKIRIIDYKNNKNDNNIPPLPPTGEWNYKKHSSYDNAVHFLQDNEDYAEFYREHKRAWDILETWLKYKTERGGGGYKTETGVKTFLKQFRNAIEESGEEEVSRVVKMSIASGYQGITWDKMQNAAQEKKGWLYE